MGIIQILSEGVANRIAAGEVIERPASIVKELIENSLDAGAKSIEVSIRHGGKSLIRVSDDGSGMTTEDVEKAFLRHATSKISSAEDLDRIESYGFRGEALPSIAAVSRTKLMTRAKGESVGTEIIIEGGKTLGVKQCPCREGTTLEIRDLFFNTPARRKFVKSDATETGHITDMVSNLALSRLDVHFLFKSSDRTIFEVLPNQSLKQRAAVVLGEETSKHLLDIQAESNGMRVSGVIGKPHAARANRLGQTFFVNQRWVKAYPFSYALQAGYHGLLMHGQFPVAVLSVEVDPARVDVNVHPTKQEVRISNEPQIKSLIQNVVAQALKDAGDLSPELEHPIKHSPAFQSIRAAEQMLGLPTPGVVFERGLQEYSSQKEAEKVTSFAKVAEVVQEDTTEKVISIRDQLHITKILGQIHHTFIVAETEEGYILVDQHAAHEKVQFESLVRDFKSGTPTKQHLLLEEILELKPQQAELLRGAMTFLRKMGFDIDEFGENTFVVRALPAVFQKEHPGPLLQSFIEEVEGGNLKTSLENHQEEIAALIACKRKSVRAYDPMTPVAMRSLLERLSQCENPFSCPHGRPSFLKFSFEELEKQFKRKK